MRIILASASPRRAEILRNAGFAYEVRPADADETLLPNESVEEYVRRLAEAKAQLVASGMPPQNDEKTFVVGADTAVLAEGAILGKPTDERDAQRMLRLLSGRTHEVLTGLAVIRAEDGRSIVSVASTRVRFLPLSEAEIRDYVATGEPFGKAGGYGIQGLAGRFVERIEGCYFNVMGLPLSKLWQALRMLGWHERE